MPPPSDDLVDSEVWEAVHFLDGAQRRWAMRRASGQSGRDLKAAIVFELYQREKADDFLQARHVVGGFRLQPCLTIRATADSRPLELDINALAVRVRRLLSIPLRDDAGELARIWTVQARQTGVIFYAIETAEIRSAVHLMEPGHVGCDRVETSCLARNRIPDHIEIRRLPRDPQP